MLNKTELVIFYKSKLSNHRIHTVLTTEIHLIIRFDKLEKNTNKKHI